MFFPERSVSQSPRLREMSFGAPSTTTTTSSSSSSHRSRTSPNSRADVGLSAEGGNSILDFADETAAESTTTDADVNARQCRPFQVEFCKQLPYNFTSFPNAMGHRDIDEAKYDIERFK